ncbi:MAG TPA: ABC transporter ATP-binding protein, partial [Reyranella sp.]|nr:ABC transporter ATP-binding protein [Reyranella sp.]
MADPLVEIAGLTVDFAQDGRSLRAVDGVDLAIAAGEALGIVGESGSGKSVTWLAALGLLPQRARIGGSVRLQGQELIGAPVRTLESVRGKRIAMIFQDPSSCLNPVHRIGWQLEEQIREHKKLGHPEARAQAIELLRAVGIPRPELRVDDYPHQFSGGMRQRAMIALALSCSPSLLIADEPTTALDVTIQAQILELIKNLRMDFNTAVVLITHDMGVVADIADRVLVMYAGRVVESGAKEAMFYDPQHPYTWGLLGS